MKISKKFSVTAALAALALVLSGCVQTKNGKPYGFVYDYLAVPGQHVMDWLAHIFGGSYGWAIIVLTVIVRMVLLPVMVKQMRNATVQQEKISMIRPQMTALQKQQKAASTPEEQQAASQAMMALYRNNGISMTGGIGCLPLLIQMPIFAALYAAIRYSPELSKAVFMNIPLGKASWILALLSFLSYLLQGYLSLLGMPEEQKKQMRFTLLLSPVMILFFTMSSPAGLGLYFFVGGLFACLQTLIINFYRPRIRREIQEKMKDQPAPAAPVVPKKVVTPAAKQATAKKVSQKNRNRNAGKQQHHK
ncbi:MAG: membrane protein insertase YidC [Levilactobacillus sp.]|jgi:YidC/Oxa1 family membrane protein insertase|uniref:Membrane protein insertase YidC n=1 Tax=Levilactobacillus suantsaiihabitans TaxID=2487722 RepID=A0A4Z0J9G3_9LACO|nr:MULTISPECIES: membrane protein insertase YidC [Levilactobacillus]MCH4123496.1 membrane protein insertase YidC [Levilactobacillus sp.]MCI1552366.1 membrane protein insertase YidC [Levilactobacillus sp.]MCI1598674.1 membrane protein insertase YidC [Levilactobacillus sp.]TGD18832.1 membrane protein insertase YidC [Levilactobacillus suantsaiihabitans]